MTDLKTPDNMQADEVVGEDELVPADDTIIGKAFVWSLAVFAVIGLGIGAVFLVLQRPEVATPAQPAAFVPPRAVDVPVSPRAVRFTGITSGAGIDFVHTSGARGDKLLPETMGGGAAFFDYDNDGDQDLLLINSTEWPDAPRQARAGARPTHALYRNDGAGKFENATAAAGLDVPSYGMGVACGDYDNDGFVDVFISNVGANLLFHNEGNGTFRDVTAQAGVGGADDAWSTSAGFADVDNDGDLDLFVCNYVKWSKEIDFAVNYTLTGVGRAYGPPTNFEGTHSYLYKNNGDGAFADVSQAAGIHVNSVLGPPMGKALGLAFADVDRDGWIDIFVANDTVQRFFFHNDGDGTFTERGAEFGVAFDRNGNATGAMGVDCAAFRNDSALGFVIGNFANEMSSLLVSHGEATQFSDEAITEGIGSPTRSSLTFGAFFFDYDLDGRLDLLHANGHIEDQINVVQPSQHYRQPAQLFWNAGPEAKACFVEAPRDALGDLAQPMVGRGAAYADIDGDGDLDVILTQVNGPPLLLRNDLEAPRGPADSDYESPAAGAARASPLWLRVKLGGDGQMVNRDAIGAWVEVTVNGQTQRRQVMPTRSYLSQVELPLTFGLGSADQAEMVRVLWPDGTVHDVTHVAAGQTLVVEHR